MTYYAEHRDVMLQRAKENYQANRAKKLAYQKIYDAKRKASGLMKKYIRKSRRKPVPEPKVFLVPIPNDPEPEPPITQSPGFRPTVPKRDRRPPPPPFVWKEASFSMTLK